MFLPVQFGRVVAADMGSASTESVAHDQVDEHCMHGKSMQRSADCGHHPSSGATGDSCCDDNCSGAQIFLPTTFDFHSISSTAYLTVGSEKLADPIISPQYRPPITHS
jgi:hypothetical protein